MLYFTGNTTLARIIVPVIIVVPCALWGPWALGPLGPHGALWGPWALGPLGPKGPHGAHGAPGPHEPKRAHGTTIMAGTIIWNNYIGQWNSFQV